MRKRPAEHDVVVVDHTKKLLFRIGLRELSTVVIK